MPGSLVPPWQPVCIMSNNISLRYLQLIPDQALPDISVLKPFLAVLVIEEPVSQQWQDQVSRWLVKSGCIFMMAWGLNCSEWDDSVDFANIEQFNFGEIPEDELVMTTCHADEKLKDVFWQAKNSAEHACIDFSNTMILHISTENKERELLSLYSTA
jgi:hypothetical protein